MILAKYGQALTIEFPVLILNGGGFAATGDWTPATGDTKVSKSAGAVANTTNNPSAVTGTGSVLWTLTLTATEMQSERVTVQIVDAALEDTVIIIHTYGNASALHAVDLDDSVRAGLTALPNAAADAAGGLPISDAGVLDLDAQIGTDIDAILVDTSTTIDDLVDDLESRLGTPSNLGSGATVAANLVDIEAQTDDIGAAGAGLTAVPWNAAWDAQVQSEVDDALVAQRLDELVNADSDIDGLAPPTVGSVVHELLTKTAGSFTYDQTTDSLEAVRDNMGTAQTGDTFARLGAPAGASVSADISAIEAQTDDIGIAGAGLTAVPWNAAWDAEVESEVDDALGAGTGTALTAIPWNAAWDAEAESESIDALNTILTDSVPSDGTIPTLRQAIYMIVQFLTERAVSGTTVTVRKVDGSTALLTLTLDDATNPTSITRAS